MWVKISTNLVWLLGCLGNNSLVNVSLNCSLPCNNKNRTMNTISSGSIWKVRRPITLCAFSTEPWCQRCRYRDAKGVEALPSRLKSLGGHRKLPSRRGSVIRSPSRIRGKAMAEIEFCNEWMPKKASGWMVFTKFCAIILQQLYSYVDDHEWKRTNNGHTWCSFKNDSVGYSNNSGLNLYCTSCS